MNRRCRPTSPARRGYVLLMVLLLLAVSATIVGAICRSATLAQSAAVREQDELQMRWGRVSCQTAFLPAADNIMDRARLRGAPATGIVWQNIVLGGQSMQLGFGDEASRVNLNAVYATDGKDGVRKTLQSLGRTGLAMPRLILGPEPNGLHVQTLAAMPFSADQSSDAEGQDAPAIIPVIGSLGQLFPDSSVADLCGAAIDVTCWGDGKINLHRASAAVIAQVAGASLSPNQLKQIIAARNAQMDVPLASLLAMGGSDAASGRLTEKFTDDSFCHSLWIVTQMGQCSAYRLAVRDATDSQRVHTAVFDW